VKVVVKSERTRNFTALGRHSFGPHMVRCEVPWPFVLFARRVSRLWKGLESLSVSYRKCVILTQLGGARAPMTTPQNVMYLGRPSGRTNKNTKETTRSLNRCRAANPHPKLSLNQYSWLLFFFLLLFNVTGRSAQQRTLKRRPRARLSLTLFPRLLDDINQSGTRLRSNVAQLGRC
jgi:hypothetical protein